MESYVIYIYIFFWKHPSFAHMCALRPSFGTAVNIMRILLEDVPLEDKVGWFSAVSFCCTCYHVFFPKFNLCTNDEFNRKWCVFSVFAANDKCCKVDETLVKILWASFKWGHLETGFRDLFLYCSFKPSPTNFSINLIVLFSRCCLD